MVYYVVPPSLGLGDFVITLPVIQALIAKRQRVICCVHSADHRPLAERVPGLEDVVMAQDVRAQDIGPNDVMVNFRAHPLQKDVWWVSREFSKQYPFYGVNEILAHMCRDFGLQIQLHQRYPLPHKHRSEAAGKIVLIPGTGMPAKAWPHRHWLMLERSITEAGGEILMLGEPRRSPAVSKLLDDGFPWRETPEVDEALDLVSSALAVVAVDTGLMHIAVHQDVPTVSLFRHAPLYNRPASKVFPVIASRPCLDECYCAEMLATGGGCPGDHPSKRMRSWECANPLAGCMSSLSPEIVFSTLLRAVDSVGRTDW